MTDEVVVLTQSDQAWHARALARGWHQSDLDSIDSLIAISIHDRTRVHSVSRTKIVLVSDTILDLGHVKIPHRSRFTYHKTEPPESVIAERPFAGPLRECPWCGCWCDPYGPGGVCMCDLACWYCAGADGPEKPVETKRAERVIGWDLCGCPGTGFEHGLIKYKRAATHAAGCEAMRGERGVTARPEVPEVLTEKDQRRRAARRQKLRRRLAREELQARQVPLFRRP